MRKEILNNEQLRMPEQTGRSMVEMLGVLAIIGVLTVMGIWGYTIAMIRYRANEILYEAHKRAVIIAGQLALGSKNPSLHEFEGDNTFSGGTFSATVYDDYGAEDWTEGNKRFTLSINGVDGSVCEQLDAMAGDEVIYFAPGVCDTKNLNEVQLTYNNDLSPDDGQDELAEPCSTGNCCPPNKIIQRVNGYQVASAECCDEDSVPYICYYEDEANGPDIEQCCCPNGNTITNFKGASACCEPGTTAFCAAPRANGMCAQTECLDSNKKQYVVEYDYESDYITYGMCNQENTISSFDRVESCCAGSRTAYCSERDSAGRCKRAGCCVGRVTQGLGPNGADFCCALGKTGYCIERNSNSSCRIMRCCSGHVTQGVGPNGADICCNVGTGYCSQRDHDGNCSVTGCCVGTVTEGVGVNGADVCTS